MTLTRNDFQRYFLLLIRFYGYLEVLLFSGIQLFWVIYTGELVQFENMLDVLALIPLFLSVFIMGIICRIKKFKLGIQKIEYILHLVISLIGISLILIFQFRDKFNQWLPFSWDYFLWILFLGLILTSNVIMNLNKVSLSEIFQDLVKKKTISNLVMISITILVTWIFALILMLNSDYMMVFWISAVVFHSLLVPISILQAKKLDNVEIVETVEDYKEINSYPLYNNWKEMTKDAFDWKTPDSQKPSFNRYHLFFNGLFSFFSIISSFFLWVFNQNFLGSIEEHHNLYYSIFISPLFYIGIIFAIISNKKSLAGDLIMIIILFLNLLGISLMVPFLLGYTIIKILIRATNQTPTRYSLTIIIMNLAFFISTYIFALSGLVLFAKTLIIEMLIGVSVGSYFVSLIFYGIEYQLNIKKSREDK